MNMVQKSTKNSSKIKQVLRTTKNGLYVVLCCIGHILNKYFPEERDLHPLEKLIHSSKKALPPGATSTVFPYGLPPSVIKAYYGVDI